MLSALVVSLLLFAASDPVPSDAAPAPVIATPATDPATPTVDDGSRVVCVIEAQTGSMFTRKTCRTKAEWKKRRERDRNAADRALSVDTTDGH